MFSELSSYKILIVDDDEDDFFITNQYIKNIKNCNFTVEWRYDYKRAMEDVCSRKYDLYLVDYYLGAKTGLDFIKEAFEKKCDEPIIILTGRAAPELDAEVMHAGAVDYLIKGEIDTEKLERCIRHVIEKSISVRTLKSNERKFRHIFERSKDAVFLMSATDMVFTDVNEATNKLFGYTSEEMKKISIFDLLTKEQDRKWIKSQLNTGEVNDKEMEMRTKENDLLCCVVSLSKETDINGNIFLQGIIHDITELKKAEKNNVRLEKLGMAERLVRTLAHEVRNPLNNINLSLEQLTEEIKTDDATLYLEIITRNSKRIETLITELLSASRPEILLQQNDLREILQESIDAAGDRMILRHINLKKHFPDKKLKINADKEKLKIAFLNIIINAVEAMEDYDTLSVDLTETKTGYNVLITDTGCGISEENLARLFEPYFTAKKNGLGLGLAATMNILQSHKASVEVESTVGVGTSFNINILN
jgi:two-component system, sporulation sensor kinase E